MASKETCYEKDLNRQKVTTSTSPLTVFYSKKMPSGIGSARKRQMQSTNFPSRSQEPRPVRECLRSLFLSLYAETGNARFLSLIDDIEAKSYQESTPLEEEKLEEVGG